MNMPVTASDGLTIVTLVMAIISMSLSCMALWPQWKDSLAMVRDVVLWMAMVAVLVAVVTVSWNRYARTSTQSLPGSDAPAVDPLTAGYRR